MRFCGTIKMPGWQNLVFWTQNQQRTHHKVGTTRPPKDIHTGIYAEGACLYTHKATHNRHTECAGLPWWSFGSRRARIVCGGSPHTFCTKPAEVRARPCQVGEVVGRAARIDCCDSLGPGLPKPPQQSIRAGRPATSLTWYGRAQTSAVFVFCTIRSFELARVHARSMIILDIV
jgi:hypothetical protein